MTTPALESIQHYDQMWQRKGDVYYRFYCNSCGCLLPEGATEETELCKFCKEESE